MLNHIQASSKISSEDNQGSGGSLIITNEDNALENAPEGIDPEELNNVGPIQDASRALVAT